MAAKPRILNSSKDLIWTLVPLLALCALVAFASQNCSVGLSGKADEDRTPAFDVGTALRVDAQTMPFPVRAPQVPADWKPNSGSSTPIGATMSSNVGWLTPGGSYIQLTQTAADEASLVGYLSKAGAEQTDPTLIGDRTRDVAGKNWVVYSAANGNKAWVLDLSSVRVALLSKGSDAELQTLATAVLKAQPLPRAR